MTEVRAKIVNDVTIQKIVGEPTFDETIEIFIEYYIKQSTRHVLWDLTAASMQSYKFEDLDRFGDFMMKFAKQREGGKTAIVASRELEYGLARTITSMAESKNMIITIHAFRTYSEGAKWLGIDQGSYQS